MPIFGVVLSAALSILLLQGAELALPSKNADSMDLPPASPAVFNPDPGEWDHPPQTIFEAAETTLFPYSAPDLAAIPMVPRLRLPRKDVTGQASQITTFHYDSYPLGEKGEGLLPYSKGVPNRWKLPFPMWQRYEDKRRETPYQYKTPALWHPYRQSILKADLPLFGQEFFTNLTAKNFFLSEYRRLPVPSGASTARPSSSDFYGDGDQYFITNYTSYAIDIFQGQTAFKPVTWLLHAKGVHNENWIWVRENNLVDPDPRGADLKDHKSGPATPRIQAIPTERDNLNPRAGDPGSFLRVVNPPDLFNYISPLLKPLGRAPSLVQVDPITQELPKGKKLEKTAKNPKRNDFGETHYTTRHRNFDSLEEAFAEIHIRDLSDNYDFLSSRVGIQPFVSDFRGFIFADTNLGARLFGNADNNRVQYNLAVFNMREKDTYSDLNTFDSRHQTVLVANAYRQDVIWHGYTTQLSFHMNLDDGGTHYDKNTFLVRPAAFGTVPEDGQTVHGNSGPAGHDVNAYYFGWAGDGHIGRLNITHAFYEVLGQDRFNQLAGREVNINAQMAALELSYDRDWIRLKLSGFYASGDSDPTDSKARGFDSIVDNPIFIGGPFSWYSHEGFNLGGTAVGLKQRDSLLPNLRTSKNQGQSNFVNPGAFILGIGTDVDLTPKLKGFANLNYIWFADTKTIQVAEQTNRARPDLGLDASIGFKYRPFLTDNVIVSAGVGFFFPGGGYRDIYRPNTSPVPGYEGQRGVDPYLYNAIFTLTLLY